MTRLTMVTTLNGDHWSLTSHQTKVPTSKILILREHLLQKKNVFFRALTSRACLTVRFTIPEVRIELGLSGLV